jgi:hypothetical protein
MQEEFKNLHFQLSKDDIKKLDKWKVSRGMKSRSEAIRSMIRIVTKDNSLEEVLHKNSFSDNVFSDKNGYEYIKKVPTNSDAQKGADAISKNLLRDIIREEILKILGENKK